MNAINKHVSRGSSETIRDKQDCSSSSNSPPFRRYVQKKSATGNGAISVYSAHSFVEGDAERRTSENK
jgi:hypothetical protein